MLKDDRVLLDDGLNTEWLSIQSATRAEILCDKTSQINENHRMKASSKYERYETDAYK